MVYGEVSGDGWYVVRVLCDGYLMRVFCDGWFVVKFYVRGGICDGRYVVRVFFVMGGMW